MSDKAVMADETGQFHPTYVKLVNTAMRLLQDHPPEMISSDAVLRSSGVSRGSLYHHFEDLSDLIETALAQMFSRTVDTNIAYMRGLLASAQTLAEFWSAIELFHEASQSEARRSARFERVRMIGMAYSNPRFEARLAQEQLRLTNAYAGMFREAQDRGYFRPYFDPRAAAVFIQAYTLGKVVDDLVQDPVEPAEWNALILRAIRHLFIAEPA